MDDSHDTPAPSSPLRPGLLPRTLALCYDGCLVVLLLIIAAVLVAIPVVWISGTLPHPAAPWHRAYLLLMVTGYYAGFWLRDGQTLGLKALGIRLTCANGRPVTGPDTLIRLAAIGVLYGLPLVLAKHWEGCLGCWAALPFWLPLVLGHAWLWVDKDRATWHDRLSGTRLECLPAD